MASTAKANKAGLARLMKSPQVVAALGRRADRIANAARVISPIDTGNYVRSWRTRYGIRRGKAWARVSNSAYYAKYLEHGTRYMKRQRVLARAVEISETQ